MRMRNALLLTIIHLVILMNCIQLGEATGGSKKNCLIPDRSGNCSCCKSGYRGPTCSDVCQHCLTRNIPGGECTHYCETGYYGKTCNKECPDNCADGNNGPNLCKEKNGLPVCDECNTGYHGEQCNQTCHENCLNRKCYQSDGTCLKCSNTTFYGDNCTRPCKQGCVDGICNTTGHCISGCKTRYYGIFCEKKCPLTCADGINSTHLCPEQDGMPVCVKCIPGYYGKQCKENCHTHCLDGKCYQTDGTCLNCSSNKLYGDHCTLRCSQGCLSGECNRTGRCTHGCKIGFHGEQCKSLCGSNCKQGKCRSHRSYPYTCTEGCNVRYWGPPCLRSCPHKCNECEDNDRCISCMDNYVKKPETGKCEKGLLKKTSTWHYLVPLVMIVIILIVVIVVFILGRTIMVICRKRRDRHNDSSSTSTEEIEIDSINNDDNKQQQPVNYEVNIEAGTSAEEIELLPMNNDDNRQPQPVDYQVNIGAGTSAEEIELLPMNNDDIRQPQPVDYQVNIGADTLEEEIIYIPMNNGNFRPQPPVNYPFNREDPRRVTTHFPERKPDIRIDGRKHIAEFSTPEREAEDELMVKFINVLSNAEERHGECLSREILEVKINEAERIFVETNGYKKARKTLQQHGFVTITGGVGEGKTTMALMLGMEYRKQGYDIVMVEDIGVFNSQLLLQATNPCFIILDDVFGSLDFSTDTHHLEKGILELLTQQAFRYTKKYIVALTSKTLKLKEGLKRIQSEKISQFFREEVRVCLGDGVASLTPDVKLTIFEKHKQNKRIYHNHDIKNVVNCKFGFPLICRMLFAFDQPITTTQNVFSDPLDFLITYITGLLSEKTSKSAACIVMFLCGDKLHLSKLEVDTDDERFESIFKDVKSFILGLTHADICVAAKNMRGTLFSEGDVIGFANPVIYDACAIALASLNIAFVLKNCTLKFICERVRGSVGGTSGLSNDNNTIQISSDYHEIFVQRLMQGIEDGHYAYVAKHPLFKFGPVESLLVEKLLTKIRNSGERRDTVINHDIVNILKLSVHGHISSLYEELLTTSITCLPTNIHTLMKECSICGNVDVLNFILRRSGSFITDPMMVEAHLLAVQNRHDKISECLIKHATEATQNMMKYFETKQVPPAVFNFMDVSQKSKSKRLGSVLKLTAQSGEDRAFMMLLKLNKLFKEDINGLSENGNNMLHLACEGGSKAIVEHFLPNFDVNSRGQNGRTPLMNAVSKGTKEVFDLLMTQEAYLTLRDDYGDTVLHLACWGGNTSIAEHLLPSFDKNSRGQNGWTPVMNAAYGGKEEVFDLLMTKGADLTLTDNNGDTVLHLACRGGNTSIVEHLLPSFDINSRGQNGWTPVMNAAYSGKKKAFDLLVTKGADLTLTDNWGDTTLHLASREGHTSIVEHLLPPCDINSRGKNGWTPVMNATYNGKRETIDLLVTYGADLTLTDDYGDTVLHLACHGGKISIVEHLIPSFDINSRGQNGWTPVMDAAISGKKEVFDLLVTKGADLTGTDNNGNTLLHFACYSGNISIVEHLLPSFDVNGRGQNGWTPGMNAAYSGRKEVFDLLVTNGADLTLTDNNGNTLLHFACHSGNISIVEHLLTPSLNINSRGKNGLTPVMNAACSAKKEVFELLMTKGADLTLTDYFGDTVLHLACHGGNTSILNKLLPLFDINGRGQNGLTPVMIAAYSGKKDTFDLLMRKGADLTLTDNFGDSALHLACREGNTSIVEHLLPSFDINSRGRNGLTPLMNAAYSVRKELFDLLVTKGADLTLTDNWGDTALHLASREGNTSIVEHILPLFDINSRGQNGLTPVMNAAINGKKEAFDLLVTKGADLTLTDNYGNTVLHPACRGGNTSIVEHLLPTFDINSRGQNGWTPVMNAAYSGKKEVFDLLVTKGADLALTDNNGNTVLHLAREGGNTSIVEHLLQII